MGDSRIEWCDKTWSPVLGCTKVSPGCAHCYAVNNTWRMSHNPNPKVSDAHAGLVTEVVPEGNTELARHELRWTGRVNLVGQRLDDPLHWKKPARIFVCSLSDLFHEQVPFEFIDRVFETIASCTHHRFLILTKRPLRMREFVEHHLASWRIPEDEVIARYLSHIWFGVSAENQATADERIPILMSMPALHRWVSAEPLLGPLDLLEWLYPGGLEWVVAGCESGKGRRRDRIAWYEALIRQCSPRWGLPGSGAPLFIKQAQSEVPSERRVPIKMPTIQGTIWNQYPPELVVK